MCKTTNKFSPEAHERAVRMVMELRDLYRSQWAAKTSIATKIACAPWTLSELVRRALKLTDRLDQRILARAFAGEVVSQDPNDEPASDLLARIRGTRAAAPKPKSKRGPRK